MLTKRGDTSPSIVATPTDAAGLIAQLSGSSVAHVIMRGVPAGTFTDAEIAADFVSYQRVAGTMAAVPKVRATASLSTGSGQITWTPTVSNVDSEGDWILEVEYDLDGNGQRIQTAPTAGYVAWRIVQDEDT